LSISGVSLIHFLRNENSFIRINNLLEILEKLGVSRKEVERQIIAYKDSSSKSFFLINFPYYLSPLHMRVGGVLIGDGNINKSNGMMRWIQNDPTPLKRLMKIILKGSFEFRINNNQIVIPSFFGKILSYSLSLDFFSLDSEKFIERSLDLPKEYSLALLIAIIEDEGNIDSRNYGGINIRISSKEIIYSIKELCDYLGYMTSQIVRYENKGFSGKKKVSKDMYKIKILSDGIKKLGCDLISLEKEYGKEIGFWKKDEQFTKRWETCINNRAEKNREGREIHKEIKRLFLKHETLSALQISNFLRVDINRIHDLLKNMYKRGEIRRIDRGIYIRGR
jgi:uncharacterized ubiquitin-like protein YukD